MKSKKNRYNGIPYTEGRNMFGEKAETKLIVLKRETALSQMLDAICQLDGTEKEFTYDGSCFNDNPEEFEEIINKAEAFMLFRASLQHKEFYRISL